MTLRHIKIFVAVFRSSSITKAANELHLAQPSVSLSIRELEEYYGIHLFERIGRRIFPTESGKEFYGYALHIVSLFDDMEKKFRQWNTSGVLRIGASITIGTHMLPSLLNKFKSNFPGLRTEITINKSAAIENLLLENAIDLGMIEKQPEADNICAVPFTQDFLCAIVPLNHPLADFSHISLEQMAQYPFLMRDKGSAGREILDAFFSLKGITVKPVWESSSTRAIVGAVAQGLGVAVLPYLLVKKDIEENTVKYVPFDKPLKRDLYIIYHKSKYLTDSMKEFIELSQKII